MPGFFDDWGYGASGALQGLERGLNAGANLAYRKVLLGNQMERAKQKKIPESMEKIGKILRLDLTDPRYDMEVPTRLVGPLIASSLQASKPSEGAMRMGAEGASIIGGVEPLGKLIQPVAKKYIESKNPVKSLLSDVGTKAAGPFPAIAQAIDPAKAQYLTQARSVFDAIGRSRSGGAIADEEWPTMQQMIPMEYDYASGPDAVKGKLDGIVNYYKNRELAYSNSIANPVERQNYIEGINVRAAQNKTDLYNSFLGGFDFGSGGASGPSVQKPSGGKKYKILKVED